MSLLLRWFLRSRNITRTWDNTAERADMLRHWSRHKLAGMLTTQTLTESFVIKHGEKIQRHHTMREPQASNPPWFLTCSPLLLYSFILSPCLSLSPLLQTLPTSILSFTLPPCLLSPPLYLGCFFFCQRASLITAEPSFSALPGEWRSFEKMKCLSRKNVANYQNLGPKLTQMVTIVTI